MNTLEIKKFYNTFDFENMITNPPKLIQEFLDGEVKFVKEHLVKGKTILEIGCGYGRLLEILSGSAKKVVGIDFSQRMISLAKERLKNHSNVEVDIMEANALKFEDNFFDYVVCLDNSFGNMPNIEEEVIREMKRVCKKDGEIIISVFSENAKDSQIENYKRIGLTEVKDTGKAIRTGEGFYSRRFEKKELIDIFEKIGLKCRIIRVSPINYIALSYL